MNRKQDIILMWITFFLAVVLMFTAIYFFHP